MLGPVEVSDGTRLLPTGGYRQRLVLAVLLSRPSEVLGTDWLIEAVWGDEPPRTARKTLQAYITRLRHLVGEDAITTVPDGYRLRAGADTLDALRFERLAREGRAVLADDPGRAATLLHEALAMWRGNAFGDLGDVPALVPAARELHEERLVTIEDRLEADLACGHGSDLVPELTDLVASHPLRERLRGHLMLALYRAGRQADSLACFEQGRRLLADELGTDPAEPLCSLHERVLRHDRLLDAPPGAGATPDERDIRNPYKGLRTFTEDDAADFYGRDDLVDVLEAAVSSHPLVAVVGASGSGKSSAVLAGLVPRLERAQPAWRVVTMTPGEHPFEQLGDLARPHRGSGVELRGDRLDLLRTLQSIASVTKSPLLLVVDQFEELATQTASQAERDRFVANLVEVAEEPTPGITLLLTVRADFFDRVLHDASLGRLAVDGLVGVVPLTPAELEAAAAAPAQRVGIAIEPELVAELVADMTDQPGALPLFEYALTETFDRRRGPTLTRADYRAVGGMRGALARRAEQTFGTLEVDERAATRQVFLRLVTLGRGREATRRRVVRRELESLTGAGAPTAGAIDAFDRARLLTLDRELASGEVTVELAHEALIESWPRFTQWVQDVRDDLRLQQALAAEVAAWQSHGCSADYLATGGRLDAYRDWPPPGSVVPTSAEAEFLERSHAEHARLARQRRRRGRQLRALVASMTVVALVASVLLAMTVRRGERIEAAALAAQARDVAAAAEAAIGSDADLSLLLALEAQKLAEASGQAVIEPFGALHHALVEHRLVARRANAADVAFVSDGRLVVAGEAVHVVDLDTGTDVLSLETDLPVVSVAASPDGRWIATGSQGARIALWDARTGERVDGFPAVELPGYGAGGPEVHDLAFDPSGRRLASLGAFGAGLDVWSLETGEIDARRVFVDEAVRVAFTPDGLRAVTCCDDGLVSLAMDEAWEPVVADLDIDIMDVAAVTPNRLVTVGRDGALRTWDDGGGSIAALSTGSTSLSSVASTPDGSRVVAGGTDGELHVWTNTDGDLRPLLSFSATDRGLVEVAVDATGRHAAGVDESGNAFVWNVGQVLPGEYGSWPGGRPLAVSPDGSAVAVADPTGQQVTIRSLPDGDVVATMSLSDDAGRSTTPVVGLVFTTDAAEVLATTASAAGSERVLLHGWEADTGRQTRSEDGDVGVYGPAAVAADGDQLAVATCSDLAGTLTSPAVVETSAGLAAVGAAGCGRAVDISADGTRLAVQMDDGRVSVWDVASLLGKGWLGVATPLLVEVDHQPATEGSVAFSPDESELLTAGVDGTARVWAVPSGRPVLVLDTGGGPVESAIWTPDGSRIVTSSHDGVPRVWDAGTGRLLAELPRHGTWPSLAVTPDGRRLLTSTDGAVRVWALDLDDLVDMAQSRVGRELTPAECERYGIEVPRGDRA